MKRFFQSEIGAAVCWVLAALLLAAMVSPWFYQAGKAFAETAKTSDLPALLESVGESCDSAKFSRYFNRALMFSSLALLPLMLRRIKALRRAAGTEAREIPKHRMPAKSALAQIAIGFVIAASLLLGLGFILDAAGAYQLKPEPPETSRLFSKIVIPGIAAPLLEEWLFRGLLLGLWLHFARPLAACVGTSLLFAFVHFLKPPDGSAIADPTHAFAGFDLLGKILLHFTDARFFVTDFATLFGVGMILAMARLRTGALWFSIGLHGGWIMAFKGFNQFYEQPAGHPLHPWGIGDSLRSGMLPMLTLGLTAVICHFVLKKFPAAPTPASR